MANSPASRHCAIYGRAILREQLVRLVKLMRDICLSCPCYLSSSNVLVGTAEVFAPQRIQSGDSELKHKHSQQSRHCALCWCRVVLVTASISQVLCLRLRWLGTDSSEEQLPSASTCFAKLKLPAYKWILDSSSGVRTSRLVSLKRLQLDGAAARIELGFTSLEHAAQKAPKMTSMRTLRGTCKTWCCFTTGHWQQPTTVRPSR